MPEFKLYYLSDGDDHQAKKITLDNTPEPGDVIFPDHGMYHLVVQSRKQKTGVHLDLSKGCQSHAEARLVAQQLEHWPTTKRRS